MPANLIPLVTNSGRIFTANKVTPGKQIIWKPSCATSFIWLTFCLFEIFRKRRTCRYNRYNWKEQKLYTLWDYIQRLWWRALGRGFPQLSHTSSNSKQSFQCRICQPGGNPLHSALHRQTDTPRPGNGYSQRAETNIDICAQWKAFRVD